MIAKRGVEIDGVYFESPPYTGEQAREKVVSLAQTLANYTGRMYLNTVSVTEIQETLMQKCDEKLFTLLLRRFMMRLAERTARLTGSAALVTGESVGQVASQTMSALGVTDEAVSLPVFRPCIGLDKEEIIVRARQIARSTSRRCRTRTAVPSLRRVTPIRGRRWKKFWRMSRASTSTPLPRAPSRPAARCGWRGNERRRTARPPAA